MIFKRENWLENTIGLSWSSKLRYREPALLRSMWSENRSKGILYARTCILDVPGKFFAETSLIYPCTESIFPIFGSEYIMTAKGYFGATDFHPTNGEHDLVNEVFSSEPDRIVENSKHYNLDTYFSGRLWHKKGKENFYDEYVTACKRRVSAYIAALSGMPVSTAPNPDQFSGFDRYMADNDPAHGILKSYFGSEFANEYIRGFLFPHYTIPC